MKTEKNCKRRGLGCKKCAYGAKIYSFFFALDPYFVKAPLIAGQPLFHPPNYQRNNEVMRSVSQVAIFSTEVVLLFELGRN